MTAPAQGLVLAPQEGQLRAFRRSLGADGATLLEIFSPDLCQEAARGNIAGTVPSGGANKPFAGCADLTMDAAALLYGEASVPPEREPP
jgi:hypothetical protein